MSCSQQQILFSASQVAYCFSIIRTPCFIKFWSPWYFVLLGAQKMCNTDGSSNEITIPTIASSPKTSHSDYFMLQNLLVQTEETNDTTWKGEGVGSRKEKGDQDTVRQTRTKRHTQPCVWNKITYRGLTSALGIKLWKQTQKLIQ